MILGCERGRISHESGQANEKIEGRSVHHQPEVVGYEATATDTKFRKKLPIDPLRAAGLSPRGAGFPTRLAPRKGNLQLGFV